MSSGAAKSVRILNLADHWPDCPIGSDISDWIAADHTREELDALIASAIPWHPREDHQERRPANFRSAFHSSAVQRDPTFNRTELLDQRLHPA